MQKKKDIFIVLIISVLTLSLTFGLISCKDKITQLSGNWNVTMIDDISLNSEDLIKGLPLIKFDTLNGMISGNTGCNDFSGDAAYTANTIEVGDIMTTLIACPDTDIEERLLKILNNQIITFNIDGDTLILTNDFGGRLTLISEE